MSGEKSSAAEGDKPGSKKAVALSARQPDSVRQTLSVEDAGEILGLSRGAAYARAKDGSLPTIRLESPSVRKGPWIIRRTTPTHRA